MPQCLRCRRCFQLGRTEEFSRGHERCQFAWLRVATLHLFSQAAAVVIDDHPCNRLEENLIVFWHLVGAAHKQSARLIQEVGGACRGNNGHDLFMQDLAVPGIILIPDEQVDGQSHHAPVGVCLHHLADDFHMLLIGHAQ